MKKEAREKLKEKNIKWEQVYTDKTEFLKEQFEAVVGPGSYFRFEGEANDGDNYYCIIGPAKVHDPRAKFFAGVRKLPATYSAGGKYFDSMDAAASYALETWGVDTPKSLKPYTSAQLYGISEKIDKWKSEREEGEEKTVKKESNMKFNLRLLKKAMSEEADKITKEAMAGTTWQRNRENYHWWNLDDLMPDPTRDPLFAQCLESEPTLMNAYEETQFFHRKTTFQFCRKYGLTPNGVSQVYKMFFGYHPVYGAYYTSIGPYKGNKPEGQNRFSYFTKRMRKADDESIQSSIDNALYKYIKSIAESYGIDEFANSTGVNLDKPFSELNKKEQVDAYRRMTDSFFGDFDKSDFSIQVRALNPFDDGHKRGENQSQTSNVVVKSDNYGDPDVLRQMEEAGISGPEGGGIYAYPKFGFNSQGQTKILEKLSQIRGFSGLLDQAANVLGNEINASPEEVKENMKTNSDTLSRVVSILNDLYIDLGDQAVQLGIDPPPVNINKDPSLKILGRSGQLVPSELSSSKEMKRRFDFKMELVEAMINGNNDAQSVLDYLQSKTKGNSALTLEYVQSQMNAINAERFDENENGEVVERKPLNQILVETEDKKQGLLQKHGFGTLQDAFEMAALFFSSKPIDKATKHKIVIGDTNVVFNPPADIIDINSQDLARLVEYRGQLTDEEIAEIVDDTAGMRSASDILEDMGININEEDEVEEEFPEAAEESESESEEQNPVFNSYDETDEDDELDFDLEDLGLNQQVSEKPKPKNQPKQPSGKNSIDQEIQNILGEDNEGSRDLLDNEDLEEDSLFDDLLDASSTNRIIIAKTLNNLIDVAEKLDLKGDYESAEKVHSLIKKYMGDQ